MSGSINSSGITEQPFRSPSLVKDLPADFDLETWCKNPICFTVQEKHMLKIYAVNPNDCSCYFLTDFTFQETQHWFHNKYSRAAYCTVIDSKLYLLGRNDPQNHVLTDLWIWDILEAQKNKLAGEPYSWQLGPRPKNAKDMVLAFSLCGDLYALDICRAFYPSKPDSMMWKTASKSIEENPIDFERLPIRSSRRKTLCWMALMPLRLENFPVALLFNGYYCLHDKFVLHMFSMDPLLSYVFCYNVTNGIWSHWKFSDLSLTSYVPENLDVCNRKALQYSAQVQNHALFINPYTGILSVSDLGAVYDLLKTRSGSDVEDPFPFVRLDVDETTTMKHIVKDKSFNDFEMCQTFYLGGTRNCWIAFYYGSDSVLNAWICTFDLEKKRTLSAVNDAACLWKISDNANVLPLSRPGRRCCCC